MPALEPLHTLDIELDDRRDGVSFLLKSSVAVPRLGIVRTYAHVKAAGRALRWGRAALPARAPDQDVWDAIHKLLDELNDVGLERGAPVLLAEHGLRFLTALGWGLDFTRCVRCGRSCNGSAACVSAEVGGLVCTACGGADVVLGTAQRERFALGALIDEDVGVAVKLVDGALAAHASIAPE